MLNTLYTHGTNIPFNHTHMHNKMLCTSKIAFNSSIGAAVHNSSIMFKMIQQKRGEAAMHVSDELQSSPTQSAYLPFVINPVILSSQTSFFAFCNSPHLRKVERDTKSLCSCTVSELEGSVNIKEVKSRAGKGRFVWCLFISSKRDAGCVRHRQRRYVLRFN